MGLFRECPIIESHRGPVLWAPPNEVRETNLFIFYPWGIKGCDGRKQFQAPFRTPLRTNSAAGREEIYDGQSLTRVGC